MIVDGQLRFQSDWVETTIAVHAGTDTVDCEVATPNFGVGTPLWVNVVVHAAFVGPGSSEQFTLWDTQDDAATPGQPDAAAWLVLIQSEVYLVGACVLGMPVFVTPLPAYHRRHLKLTWEISGAVLTEGSINAWIGLDPAPDNS